MKLLTKNTIIRIIKLIVGTISAIHLADYFGLNYSFSAGIIAMLSIMDTRLLTLKVAVQRFISLVLGLALGIGLFYYFGYSLSIFALLLLIYIPLSMYLNVISGLVPTCVLLSHFMISQSVDYHITLNAVSLMIIGLGIATILNLYMPSNKKAIKQLATHIEETISSIFTTFSHKLMNDEKVYSQQDNLLELDKLETQLFNQLTEMDNLVKQEVENNFFVPTTLDYEYLILRKEQAAILKYMIKNIKLIKQPQADGKLLGEILSIAAKQINRNETPMVLVKQIEQMIGQFSQYELPHNREEFEDRAIIYRLMTEYERFLHLKQDFIHKKNSFLKLK